MVKAKDALTTHIDALHAISKRLAEVETLEREEYEALLKHMESSLKMPSEKNTVTSVMSETQVA
jgi:ATP-dependent Zn protease